MIWIGNRGCGRAGAKTSIRKLCFYEPNVPRRVNFVGGGIQIVISTLSFRIPNKNTRNRLAIQFVCGIWS